MSRPSQTSAGRAQDHHRHDQGLPEDLSALRALQARRRALALLGSVGVGGALASCGDFSPFGSVEAEVVATAPGGAQCVAHPAETAGPFPADGSNQAHGSLANVLEDSGILRSDLRPDIGPEIHGELKTAAVGVRLDLALRLVSVKGACAPLAGYAVYLWHCDAAGRYSLYELPGKTYLRGVGVSDAGGEVRFTTIVPGCYRGRYPHMHFEVYPNLAKATDYSNRILTSQLALPRAVCDASYRLDSYAASAAALSEVSLARDGIFGNNTARQVAAQTLKVSGDAQSGYHGDVTIGLSPA